MATASAPVRRTQAERSALSEARLLRAAMRLIAKRGFSRTTLADIGKAAGYSRGLAGHRFGSKEGLLDRLVEHVGSRFLDDQVMPALDGCHGVAALAAMVDAYLNELKVREERLHALYVLMGEALGPVPEIRGVFVKLNASFRDLARRAIDEAKKAGEIRADVDPAVEAVVFVGMLRGAAMQWVTDPGCFEIGAVRDAIVRTLEDHLGAGGGRPVPAAAGRSRKGRR